MAVWGIWGYLGVGVWGDCGRVIQNLESVSRGRGDVVTL